MVDHSWLFIVSGIRCSRETVFKACHTSVSDTSYVAKNSIKDPHLELILEACDEDNIVFGAPLIFFGGYRPMEKWNNRSAFL